MSDEQPDVTQKDTDSPEDIAKASVLGWKPREEWNGEEKEWRSAAEFLRRGEEIGAFMKRDLQTLRSQNAALQSQLQEMSQTMEEFREFSAKAEQRAYERAVKDLKAEKRNALREGDHERVAELEDQLDGLEPPAKPTKRPPAPKIDPEFLQWRSENAWFGDGGDLVATALAETLAAVVARENPGLTGRAFYDKVKERVKQEVPERFGVRQPPIDSGGRGGHQSKRGNGRSYNDLPPEAQAQCDKFIEQKFVKNREEYCAAYDWS